MNYIILFRNCKFRISLFQLYHNSQDHQLSTSFWQTSKIRESHQPTTSLDKLRKL